MTSYLEFEKLLGGTASQALDKLQDRGVKVAVDDSTNEFLARWEEEEAAEFRMLSAALSAGPFASGDAAAKEYQRDTLKQRRDRLKQVSRKGFLSKAAEMSQTSTDIDAEGLEDLSAEVLQESPYDSFEQILQREESRRGPASPASPAPRPSTARKATARSQPPPLVRPNGSPSPQAGPQDEEQQLAAGPLPTYSAMQELMLGGKAERAATPPPPPLLQQPSMKLEAPKAAAKKPAGAAPAPPAKEAVPPAGSGQAAPSVPRPPKQPAPVLRRPPPPPKQAATVGTVSSGPGAAGEAAAVRPPAAPAPAERGAEEAAEAAPAQDGSQPAPSAARAVREAARPHPHPLPELAPSPALARGELPTERQENAAEEPGARTPADAQQLVGEGAAAPADGHAELELKAGQRPAAAEPAASGKPAEREKVRDAGRAEPLQRPMPEARPNRQAGRMMVRRASWPEAREKALRLLESKEAVVATVLRPNRGGLPLMWNGLMMFVPFSMLTQHHRSAVLLKEMQLAREGWTDAGAMRKQAYEAFAGRKMRVVVVGVDQDKLSVVASEAAAYPEELREQSGIHPEAMQVLLQQDPEQLVECSVAAVKDFGLFVHFNVPTALYPSMQVPGLVHATELSWDGSTSPTDSFSVGDSVQAVVTALDPRQGRVSLSIKRVGKDPLQQTLSSLLDSAQAAAQTAAGAVATGDGGAQGGGDSAAAGQGEDLRETLGNLPIVEEFCDWLNQQDGVEAQPWRRLQGQAFSQDLQLFLSRQTHTDELGVFRAVVRSGNDVQEIQLKTGCSRKHVRTLLVELYRASYISSSS